MRNLHCRFDWHYIGQIYSGNFAKFCGFLRIYELYQNKKAFFTEPIFSEGFGVDKVRELDHKKSEQSLRQGRKKQREMTKVKWRPRVRERTGLVQSKSLFLRFGLVWAKEIQIVYRLLFLVNCYLPHVPRLPSQPASNVGG